MQRETEREGERKLSGNAISITGSVGDQGRGYALPRVHFPFEVWWTSLDTVWIATRVCNWPCDLITFALLNFMTAVGLNNSATPTHQTLHYTNASPASFASMSVCCCWRSAIKAYNGTRTQAVQQPNRPYLTIFVSAHTHTHTQRIWILITLAPDTHATGERKKNVQNIHTAYILCCYLCCTPVNRAEILHTASLVYLLYSAQELYEVYFKIGTVI